METKKILFITHQLPYPPNSGGVIKSWKLLEFLSKRYEVGLACLLKSEDKKSEETIQSKLRLTDYYSEYLAIPRSYITILKGLLLHSTINFYRNYSPSFQQKIKSLAKNYQILLIDHYEMYQYVPADFKGKVILHTHNAEFMLWQRMAEIETNPIKKLLLSHEAKRVLNAEKKMVKQSQLVFATPSDQKIYKKFNFELSHCRDTYHLGNDDLLELEDILFEETEKAITFMGTMDWEPNVDGLLWFIQDVYPSIKKEENDIKLYVLGGNVDDRIKQEAAKDKSIVLTGFVKEIDTYLKKTRVFIVPLRFGSGMKVKVLDGMFRGTPMVSSSVGAEGIKIRHQEEVLIADEANDFAKNCLQLLNNKILWNKLRTQSRRVAKESYLWKDLLDRMHKEIETL